MAYEDATMEWVDGNLGSRLTMKYPAVYMMEPGARGEILSIAFAGKGQHQDAGAKVVHMAPDTTSARSSRSRSPRTAAAPATAAWCRSNGDARALKCNVVCDALILDEHEPHATPTRTSRSTSRTYDRPRGERLARSARSSSSTCMSRGLTEAEASAMIVNGFIEPLVKELPMEYAVEMNRLIQLQMEGSVG